jgi:hypothetical protein
VDEIDLAADLERAGLLVVDGDVLRLTPEGEALARLVAMGKTDEADAVLDALLGNDRP